MHHCDHGRGGWRGAGSPTTGATTRSASSRPDARFATGDRGEQVREFKTMVKALHRAGIEVLLDVVYNHTGEGDAHGARRSPGAASTTPPTTGSIPRDPGEYLDFTGCGNSAEPAAPARAPARARQPALLGGGDARRRLPLRPGPRAGARLRARATGSSASSRWCSRTRCCAECKLIAEPWDLGETATGSATFRPAGRSGTASTATPCAASGAATRAAPASSRRACPGARTSTARPHAARERQLRHLPRRLHAARPGELRAEAQRGQRRGEPRRHRRQLELELGRGGRDRRRRGAGAARAHAAELPRDARLLAGRPDALARRRAGPHAARQQQRLLPGRPAHLGRLGARRSPGASCSTSRAACSRCGARIPCCAGAASSPAARAPRVGRRT